MDPDLEIRSSDDEETLAMKENLLKIKLRKKQLAKAASPAKRTPQSRPTTPPPKPIATLQNPFASPKSAGSIAANSRIQVPGSPSPQKHRPPISPARIILGIDKGRTGKDVSLKRTPEKPSRSFNQRITDSKTSLYTQENKAKQLASKRSTSFNPVPAFSTASGSIDVDNVSKLRVSDRKVSPEDCSRAAEAVTKVLSIRDFYGHVSPPNYDMPEDIADYIVYGIVATKTTARTTSSGAKYCVMQFTDLKTDITLFLYDSAFEKYWTLPLGSFCYLLNPQFQKPRGAAKLSLKMTDSTGVLEIGKAADFGICRSIKKDGTQCTMWIDAKKQEVCEFHIDMTLQKTFNKRIEFASGTRLYDPREPSKKKRKEAEEYSQHALFFGDAVTTLKGSGQTDESYEMPVKDTARLQKEADARQREREVLARLMKNSSVSAGHEYFETTDPNASAVTEDDLLEKEKVFSASMLRKLGFDPTKRLNQSIQAHSQTTNASDETNGEAVLSEREKALQKDVDSVNLSVSLGKGSAMFTREGIEAAKVASGIAERNADNLKQGEADSDSDLEIVH